MREAQVTAELCDGCQDCIDVCRYDAIHLVRRPPAKRLIAEVDPNTCCGCIECEDACLQHGIILQWVGHHPPSWAAF